MGNFTLCEMLKSLPLDSCHPILVAKQDPGSRCFQSADCFWVLPVAKMLWDEVVKKTLIHRHLGVTCLIFRHFMSLSITFCCSFCGIDYTHLHFVIRWHDLEMNNIHFWHQAAGQKSDHDQLDDCETLWTYVKVPQLDPQIRPLVNYIRCHWQHARLLSHLHVNGWQMIHASLLHLIPENNLLEISENCGIAARRHTIWLFKWRF